MAKPQTIVRDGSGTRSVSYTLPPGVFQYIESILVEVDNGSGSAVNPELSVATTNGQVMADKRQGRAIPAGDTGRATWALRLDDEGGEGVTSVVSGDPELWTFPTTGPAVAVGRFTLAARMTRDAAAAAATVASGALVVMTTQIQHNIVDYQHGITASAAAVPSRLTIVSDGLYLVHTTARWADVGAADFGFSIGFATTAGPGNNPQVITRRVPNQVLCQEAVSIQNLSAGATITQAAGQNSGVAIAQPLSTLTAYRLGPKP